jgi:hypothetical protein
MVRIVLFAAYLVAGMAAQFLWPFVEHALPALLPQVSSTLASRISLASSGLLLALTMVGLLVLIAPPSWPRCGAALVAGYFLGGIPSLEPDGEFVLLFQLPEIWGWAFLASSLILIWFGSRARAHRKVA